jgi:hypothetical protein
MEQVVCSVCGQPSEYREGINKAGKSYAGYFCSDKVGCKNVDWVKLHTPAPKPVAPPAPKTFNSNSGHTPSSSGPKPVSKDDFNETKQENSLMMCATNLVVAQINAGALQAVGNPGDRAVQVYWQLKEGLISKPTEDWPEEPINEG